MSPIDMVVDAVEEVSITSGDAESFAFDARTANDSLRYIYPLCQRMYQPGIQFASKTITQITSATAPADRYSRYRRFYYGNNIEHV